MRTINLIFLLFLSQLCFAQVPTLGVFQGDKSKSLTISTLDINVEVVGNIATTTYDILFYNPYHRILEGELSMPLKNGQEICRYALDINGKLREGVVVEKVKARQAFEAVVRRKIDPGYITKTKGNSFKTRIFPIPAKGVKRVVIALSETLSGDDENLFYILPFGDTKKIDEFSLSVKVIKQKADKREFKSDFQNIDFDSFDEASLLTINKKDFEPEKPIKFTIPRISKDSYQVFTCDFEGQTYFYLNLTPEKLGQTKPTAPTNIGIYWDNSLSASKRDIEKELELLKLYLSELQNVANVTILNFNCSVSGEKTFVSSEVKSIVAYINALENDGGTRLGNIDFSTNFDEILLFSDGVSSIGNSELSADAPVIAITSSLGSDYALLKLISEKSNGEFIDLSVTSVDRALQMLQFDEEKFLSCKYKSSQIKEVYPKFSKHVQGSFEVVGILEKNNAELTVNFGSKKRVSQSETFIISKGAESPTVARIWATKKIEYLEANFEKNREEIYELSQKHNIISKNTAMLVLESVSDYVKYEIVPPEELQKEYYRILANSNKNRSKEPSIKEIRNQNVRLINRLSKWYDSSKKVKNISNKIAYSDSVFHYDSLVQVDGTQSIEGFVVDFETGDPVPFATLEIRNSGDVIITGGTADFDGEFLISDIPSSESLTLTVYYIGYDSQTFNLSEGYPNTIRLQFLSETLGVVESMNYQIGDDINITLEEEANVGVTTVGGVFSRDGERGTKRGIKSNALQSSIKVLAWMPNPEYMIKLRAAKTDDIMELYYALKVENRERPSFYIQVSDYLFSQGMHEDAVRILTNSVELDLENPELLKVVARRLCDEGEYEMAIELYKEILDLRPEEPQSYRDLALAYTQNGQYQKALEKHLHILDTKWERFDEIKAVVFNELNALIAQHKDELNLSKVDKKYIKPMPLDIRITIDWSSNDNDIDLWVIDPNAEKCYYSHNKTKLGGKISKDFTQGYGPEEFTLKNAKRGFYTVYVNYYSESRQTITGPVTVYVVMTTNYGTEMEKTERIAVQLESSSKKRSTQVAQLEFVE